MITIQFDPEKLRAQTRRMRQAKFNPLREGYFIPEGVVPELIAFLNNEQDQKPHTLTANRRWWRRWMEVV